jgi:hypothetical protein
VTAVVDAGEPVGRRQSLDLLEQQGIVVGGSALPGDRRDDLDPDVEDVRHAGQGAEQAVRLPQPTRSVDTSCTFG